MKGHIAHGHPRTRPHEIAARREELYAILERTASKGHTCPSLASLAALLHVHDTTVANMLDEMRRAGRISWTIHRGVGCSTVRVVTIAETGRTTARPHPTGRNRNAKPRPEFTPAPGFEVRVLKGKAFREWKHFYEAREAEERRRRATAA